MFHALTCKYAILAQIGNSVIYPFLRSEQGKKTMWQVSPIHGRSYVVDRTDNGRYVVSKGNGLAYSERTFLYTSEII